MDKNIKNKDTLRKIFELTQFSAIGCHPQRQAIMVEDALESVDIWLQPLREQINVMLSRTKAKEHLAVINNRPMDVARKRLNLHIKDLELLKIILDDLEQKPKKQSVIKVANNLQKVIDKAKENIENDF